MCEVKQCGRRMTGSEGGSDGLCISSTHVGVVFKSLGALLSAEDAPKWSCLEGQIFRAPLLTSNKPHSSKPQIVFHPVLMQLFSHTRLLCSHVSIISNPAYTSNLCLPASGVCIN